MKKFQLVDLVHFLRGVISRSERDITFSTYRGLRTMQSALPSARLRAPCTSPPRTQAAVGLYLLRTSLYDVIIWKPWKQEMSNDKNYWYIFYLFLRKDFRSLLPSHFDRTHVVPRGSQHAINNLTLLRSLMPTAQEQREYRKERKAKEEARAREAREAREARKRKGSQSQGSE